MIFTFKLPLPPSINNDKWINPKTGRIVKKTEVRDWKISAEILLHHIKPQPDTDWELDLDFYFFYIKTPRRFDTDNRLKPLFDALAKRIGIDDSRLCRYTVRKFLKQGREAHFVTGTLTLV